MTVARRTIGPTHSDTLNYARNFERLLLDQKKNAEAGALFGEIMQTGGPGHPMAPNAIIYMSRILCDARKWREAEQELRELLAVREQSQPDAWSTFNTKSQLGEALMGQKKYVETEPLLLQGHVGMKAREKTIPPEGSERIPEALDRLIELYTLTMKPDETKKWKAERAEQPMPKDAGTKP